MLVRTIDNAMAASQLSNRSRNTLPSWPLKRLTPNHVDLVGERENHVLVAAKMEIIGFNAFRVPLKGESPRNDFGNNLKFSYNPNIDEMSLLTRLECFRNWPLSLCD